MTHPVTRHRVRVTADTIGELEARCENVRRVARDLRYGQTDPAEALRRLRAATVGRAQTVRELWARYEPGLPPRSRDTSLSAWRRRLEPYFGDSNPWQLTEDRMRVWVSKLLEGGFAPKTIHFAYDVLVCAYKMAIRSGDLDRLPWGDWRPPRARRLHEPECCRSLEDCAAFLAQAREHDERRWAAGEYSHTFIVCTVGMLMGLRHSELGGLAWDCLDIDKQPEALHLRHQAKRGWWRRHADRPRDPPKVRAQVMSLHPSAAAALRFHRQLLQERGWYRYDGPVFPAPCGPARGTWSRKGDVIAPRLMRTFARAAGLPRPERWNVHSLRHTHSSLEVLFSGGDLRAAAKRTRHASIQQLEGYVHAMRRHDRSFIPELAPPTPIPELPPPASPAELIDGLTLGASESRQIIVAELRPAAAAQRKDERCKARKAGRRPVEEIAAEWIAAGGGIGRPRAINEAARAAYVRAYTRAKRDGKAPEECRQAGARSKKACLANWAAAFHRARRAADSEN